MPGPSAREGKPPVGTRFGFHHSHLGANTNVALRGPGLRHPRNRSGAGSAGMTQSNRRPETHHQVVPARMPGPSGQGGHAGNHLRDGARLWDARPARQCLPESTRRPAPARRSHAGAWEREEETNSPPPVVPARMPGPSARDGKPQIGTRFGFHHSHPGANTNVALLGTGLRHFRNSSGAGAGVPGPSAKDDTPRSSTELLSS